MERITRKHLDALCARLNRLTNSPMTYMDADRRILPGNWHIDGAYGGYCLMRTCANGSGAGQPMGHTGHLTARELYNLMHAFIAGLEFAKYGE